MFAQKGNFLLEAGFNFCKLLAGSVVVNCLRVFSMENHFIGAALISKRSRHFQF